MICLRTGEVTLVDATALATDGVRVGWINQGVAYQGEGLPLGMPAPKQPPDSHAAIVWVEGRMVVVGEDVISDVTEAGMRPLHRWPQSIARSVTAGDLCLVNGVGPRFWSFDLVTETPGYGLLPGAKDIPGLDAIEFEGRTIVAAAGSHGVVKVHPWPWI